jgi:hypothetical protein
MKLTRNYHCRNCSCWHQPRNCHAWIFNIPPDVWCYWCNGSCNKYEPIGNLEYLEWKLEQKNFIYERFKGIKGYEKTL